MYVLQQWRKLDTCITDASNEAQDNTKFLNAIKKLCPPLYGNNPMTLRDSLRSLIDTIINIHGVSRYYNTSERMTSLFVKVVHSYLTSQMSNYCSL